MGRYMYRDTMIHSSRMTGSQFLQLRVNQAGEYCGRGPAQVEKVGWSDLALQVIFENGLIAVAHVYF